MDNQYIRGLRIQKKSVGKRLYATICLLLVAALLASTTSYAWLILSQAPEITEVTTTLGANGNLEIALNTNGLETLAFSANEDPSIGIESMFEKNSYWGNLIDLSDERYGLQQIQLKPAALNIATDDPQVLDADSPIKFAQYSLDGRIQIIDDSSAAATYDSEAAQFVGSSNYGVRAAGIQSMMENSVEDVYAFSIDLLFRTNAEGANLLLQTLAADRIYNEENAPEDWEYYDEWEAVQGSGSNITMENKKLQEAIRVAFVDTLTGEVYGIAAPDENGDLYLMADPESAQIKPLVKNIVTAISVWIYLEGNVVENLHADTDAATEMKVNLQFATDVKLDAAFGDDTTKPSEPLNVGPVSDLRFEMTDSGIALTYHYPEGITEAHNSVLYDVILTNSNTGKKFVRQNITNSILLTEYSGITAGTYNKFQVDSELNYAVIASANFDNLELVVSERESTAERIYVRIDPTSEQSNYAYTYVISGLTPNTLFWLYTASESVALGTSGGPTYSAVRVGMSDANGNITANLGAWDTIQNLKDDPSEQGAELTKLYFKIVECTDINISADGMKASFTRNLRCDWTHYVPGGVGTNVNQSGSLGDNASWSYSTDGTLRISGSGVMAECEPDKYPWSGLRGVVTKIIIEDGITSIGDWAFREFIRLQSVSFGDTITEIGAYAFYQCYILQNIVLPENLKTIENCAFRDCESITSLVVPDNVTEIGVSAFSGCSALETVTLSAKITRIPQTAFGWCGSLTSIVIPESVTSIGSQAFDACSNLADVYYGGSRSMWQNIDIIKTGNTNLLNATIHYAIQDAVSDSSYYLEQEGNNQYSFYTFNNDGSREYELTFTGSMDSGNNTIVVEDIATYPTNGVVIPAIATFIAENEGYAVSINPTAPFANLGTENASISFVSVDGQKVTPSSQSLSNLFDHNTGTEFVSIDLSGLDTGNVTNMSNLVYGCDKLTYLNLEGVDTSKVTNMSYMFAYCNSLTALDVSNFNTENVKDMNNMFYLCSKVTVLDVSGFDTSKVTDMNRMFAECSSVTELDVSNFDTSNVTRMDLMFAGCPSLTELDVTSFNTAKVTNMFYMFSDLEGITELDLSSFDTTNVTNLAYMFDGSSSLTKLDLSHFNTTNVTVMAGMFYGCTSLVEVDISGFDTAKVTNMWALFRDCENLAIVDISNFNTANVEDMCYMFYRCFALTELDLSHFNTAKVTSMRYMFYGCRGLTELNISNFDTGNVTEMDRMFEGCKALTRIDVSSFNTAKVANMREMFQNCVLITELDLSNFDIANVTDMTSMFSGCTKLTVLDLSGWDLSTVSEISGMFYNCPAGSTYIN